MERSLETIIHRRLEELYDRIRQDPRFRTPALGRVFVPGQGFFEDHPVVFVGEAPGREEERERIPFVGSAGRNLNSLLAEIQLPREKVFVTNLVKFRPMTPSGKNRNPSLTESSHALPFLLEEIEILSPRIVVCLGLSAAKALLQDSNLRMGAVNGHFFHLLSWKVLVTYHPSPYNYHIPQKRLELRSAFLRLKNFLDQNADF